MNKKVLGLTLVAMLTAGLASCSGGSELEELKSQIASLQESVDSLTASNSALTSENEKLKGLLDTWGIEWDKKIPELQLSYNYVDTTGLEGYDLESATVYNRVFGNFAHQYEEAGSASSLSEKYALEAIAEAKLLESGAFLPGECNGGSYGMSRVAYKSVPGVAWGTDEYRVGSAIVCNEIIKASDRDELKALYVAKKGTGTYLTEAKALLASKGYTFTKNYTYGYTGDPNSWDVLSDYYAATAEPIVLTYDGLMQYDVEDTIQPALAVAAPVWGTNAEGEMTCTFTIRDGVKWTKNDGTFLANVTADDFVAGFQHMLDAGTHSWYVDGLIKGVGDYDGSNFGEVGVKANGQTLVYTFEKGAEMAKDYFLTMLGYSPLAPLCRSFYVSEGGKFGTAFLEAETAAEATGTYASDFTHIAYCGAFRISQFTAENTFVFEKNPDYYNSDIVNVDTITWLFNDGSDPLKNYNMFKAGEVASSGLSSVTLPLAKEQKPEGSEKTYFEEFAYVSGLDCGSYPFWFNGNRKTFTSTSKTYPLDSMKSESEKSVAQAALANDYFRLALASSIDRVAYETALTGDADIAANSLLNTYTPGHFVHLPEAVTVKINGVDKTFPAGASYGEIVQAQIEADGFPWTIWKADPTAEDGRGTTAGFDGWYNPEWAVAFLNKAIEELKADGIVISKEHPVVLELPYISTSASSQAGNAAVKLSIEKATAGLVKVNLLPAARSYNLYYAAYYTDYGYETNVDISKISGWGPDYGDPKTFLDTFLPTNDGMVKNFGIY